MLLFIFIFIAICISFWFKIQGYSFYINAMMFCFVAVILWLIITLVFCSFLPKISFEKEIYIDGFHLDPSFFRDNLLYIVDGECFHVVGNVTTFYGGAYDLLIISENYIDVPDWFWIISFMDYSRVPWSIDYFIC